MGGQIAQAIASSDTPVVIKDVDQKFVDHAIEEVHNVTSGQLGGLVKKEKITQEQADARLAEVLSLVTGTVTYEEFGDVDFVIEAVPEKMAIKQAVFAELDAVTPGHAILSSNTSSLSISEMAEATIRPDKVVGFHFFYPASVMPLVEVIIGDETTSETVRSPPTSLRPSASSRLPAERYPVSWSTASSTPPSVRSGAPRRSRDSRSPR